jgi:hypothetical protein
MRRFGYTTRAYVYIATLRMLRVGFLVQAHMDFDTTLFALLSQILESLLLRSFPYNRESFEQMRPQSRFAMATSQ